MRSIGRRDVGLVLSLIALAAVLRIAGIGWGLPDLFEEATPLRKAWEMWGWGPDRSLDLNPHFFNYPTLTFYLQFIGQLILYAAMAVFGGVGSGVDFQLKYLFDKTPFVIVGRLINAVFGVVTVGLIYRLGRRIDGRLAGTVAAFFLAINVFHIERSQMIEVDVALTCFVTLALLLILRFREHSGTRAYLFVGIVIGLAMSSKYTGAFLALPLVVGHFLLAKRRSWRNLLVGLAAAAVAFAVTSPYVLIDFSSFRLHLTAERTHMAIGHFGGGDIPTWRYYGEAWTQRLLGWPVSLLAVAGIVLFLIRRQSWAIVLASFLIPYLAVVATWEMRVDRYLLPVLPVVILFAAVFTARLLHNVRLTQNVKARRAPALLLILFLALPILARYPKYLFSRLATDTRTEAREWIVQNLPAGSLIASEFYAPAFLDPLTFWQLDGELRSRIRAMENIPKFFATLSLPLYTVRPEQTAVFYDIGLYDEADFVITSSSVKGRYLAEPERFATQVAFYRDLEQRMDELIRFVPEYGTGPELTVYRNPKHDVPFGKRAKDGEPLQLQTAETGGGEAFFYYTMGLDYETYGAQQNAFLCYRNGIRYPTSQRGLFGDLALGISRTLVAMGKRDEAIEALDELARRAPDRATREHLLRVRDAEF